MSILAAVALPNLALWIIARIRGDAEFRRAALIFIGLTLLWFAPCWLFQATPVPLDFISGESPWKPLRPPGYLNKNFLLNDLPLQMLPWREATRSDPFLNRFAGSGTPLWQNLQTAILYPVNVAGIPFSTFAWPLFSATAKVLIALCGMYLLIRGLGLSFTAAAFAAIAYGFGGFTIAYLLFPHTNVTVLLPLLLYFLQRDSFFGTIVVLTSIFLGGHPESVLHVAIVAIPWALRAPTKARLVRYPLIALVSLALAAPVLLPFAAYLPHSQRIADIAANPMMLSSSPFELASFVPFAMPNYFGNPRVHNYRHAINFSEFCTQYAGLTTLALAIGAVVIAPRRRLFEIALLIVATLLSITPAPLQDVIRAIPIVGLTAHSRARFLIVFLLALLAAYGVDELMSGKHRRLFAIIAGALFIGVAATALISYPTFARFGIRRLIFFTEIFALLGTAAIAFRFLRGWMLCALLYLDLATVMGLYNPAVGREFYYPTTPALERMRAAPPYRIVGIGLALQPNTATFFGLEDIRVHDPLAFRPYVELLDRAGFDRSTYFGRFTSLPPQWLLDALGVRYVIAADGSVHENPTARPRYVVADGTLRLVRYGAGGATIDIETDRPTSVTTSEVALPGWRLERNGRRWPLEKHVVFLGWKVPPGGGRFNLRYRPPYLVAGLWMAGAAIAMLLAIGSLRAFRTTSSRAPTVS